ncbi:hypothetical protein IFO70_10485 [Phormidium tenue FACHB-886]|nr:hypothetical protein [Phormidium tenue FACHB-886]
MQKAIKDFRENIARARNLGGLYSALTSLTTGAIDASDILRAQIVLSVSALDCFVHELTLLGMLEVFSGKRPATPSFLKFRISMDFVLATGGSSTASSSFELEIRERHSFLSFQQPEKVAEAIRLFSDVVLWQQVSSKLSISETSVKNQLKLIVDRRNKIAHEADIDPTYGVRWPISEIDVISALDFIEKLCESIYDVVV